MMDTFSISQLREIITEHYRVGEIVDYEQLLLGYESITYIIETELNNKRTKYCFRRYNQARREGDIQFEHSVINHLVARGFELASRIIPTISGESYVKRLEGSGENTGDIFYTVFAFLSGEDTYTWYTPPTNREALGNSAVALARFHDGIFDLEPGGERHAPTIMEFVPTIIKNLGKRAEMAETTGVDISLLENLSLFNDNIVRTLDVIDENNYSELPHQVIHRDYHPGNLKFENNSVTGLFDYDWTKIEARCFDVATAVLHFCTIWLGDRDGHLDLDKVVIFLDSYQKTLKGKKGVGPLSNIELEYLPHLFRAGIIQTVDWYIEDFYDTKIDSASDFPEYSHALKHYASLIRWLNIKVNWEALVKICE
ncbi:phosphotransferase [Chloroflexota bacterium]